MMRILAGVVLSAGAAGGSAQTVIPTRYLADRFFAAPITQQGDTVVLLLDTGGGAVFAIKPVIARMGLSTKFVSVEEGDSVFARGRVSDVPARRGDSTSSRYAPRLDVRVWRYSHAGVRRSGWDAGPQLVRGSRVGVRLPGETGVVLRDTARRRARSDRTRFQ